MNNSIDHRDEAVLLLDLIIEKKWEDLKEPEKFEVQENVLKIFQKSPSDPMILKILLRTYNPSTSSHLTPILISNLKSQDEQVLYFTIKLLIKFCKENLTNVTTTLDLLMQNNIKLSAIVNLSTVNPKHFPIFQEVMTLIAIILQHATMYMSFDPIENMKIPQMFKC